MNKDKCSLISHSELPSECSRTRVGDVFSRSTTKFKIKKSGQRLRQAGQATIEYALLLSVAAMIGTSFYKIFMPMIGQTMITFNIVLESELMTGDVDDLFPEAGSGWEN